VSRVCPFIAKLFGRLFKNKVRLYVYPMEEPASGSILSAGQSRLSDEKKHLLHHLISTGCVRAIPVHSQEFLFHTSAEVRKMVHDRDPHWQALVPDIVLKQGPWKELGGTEK